MSKSFPDVYAEVLANAQTMVAELEDIDPESVSRDNWEEQFAGYMEALDELEEREKEMYAAIFDETSGKGRIREYLKDKTGEPVKSDRLARISGISEYARRVRELRNEEGFVIDSTRTREELGQNDYFMVEIQDVDVKSRITAQTRYEQLEREENCAMCGRDVGHSDVRYMEVDHIESFVDYDDPDAVNDPSNLRTLCNECHHGKSASDNIANRRRGGRIEEGSDSGT
jgi:5-methylcytosine-specific restriction endonuclease McrA